MTMLANTAGSAAMLLVGLILMIVILFRRYRRAYRRRNRRSPQKQVAQVKKELDQQAPRTEQPLADAPPNLLRWQVEMHDTARELKAELDTKIGVLQATIRLSDQQAKRLKALIDRAEALGLTDRVGSLEEIEQLAEGMLAGEGLAASQPASSELAAMNEDFLERHQQILKLANQGHDASAIAEQTGFPVGEVELVLSAGPADGSTDSR